MYHHLKEIMRNRMMPLLLALIVLTISGCAWIKAPLAPEDCRSCHSASPSDGARDFGKFYSDPTLHHPVGRVYPEGTQDARDFHSPASREDSMAFFDRNMNGRADDDEVRLYENANIARVECASCHRPHGRSRATVSLAPPHYLRMDNTGSALCLNCHRK